MKILSPRPSDLEMAQGSEDGTAENFGQLCIIITKMNQIGCRKKVLNAQRLNLDITLASSGIFLSGI